MTHPNKINLAGRLREDPVLRAEGRALFKRALPFLAVIAVTLAVEGFYLLGAQAALNREYDALSEEIIALQPAYADMLIRSKQRDLLAEKNIGLEDALDAVNSYGELTPQLLSEAYRAANACRVSIDALEFDRSNGRLSLTCTGPKITSPLELTERLEQLEGVASADYGGYTLDSAGQTAYRFELVCLLTGGTAGE